MKKICIISPSFLGGGAEKTAVTLANNLVKLEASVDFIVVNGIGSNKLELSDKINLIDLMSTRSRYAIFKLFLSLKKINPDCVLSIQRECNIILGINSYILKLNKIIFREASNFYDYNKNSMISRLYYFFLRILYQRANSIIAPSISVYDDFLLKKIIKDIKKIKVINNPSIKASIKNDSLKVFNHPWINNEKFKVIVSMGRLSSEKNFSLLIDSFNLVNKKFPNTRLIILGEGQQKDDLNNLILQHKLKNKVDLIGYKINPYPYIAQSSVYVSTSIFEGFNCSLVEAFSLGIPIIATPSGGAYLSIKPNKLIKIIPKFEINVLAETIVNVINDPYSKKIDIKEFNNLCYEFDEVNVSKKVRDFIL